MQLTVEEHENLNNAYRELGKVRNNILERTFSIRNKSAREIRNLQNNMIADWFHDKKVNIDILDIKGYVGNYYESPKVGGYGEVI